MNSKLQNFDENNQMVLAIVDNSNGEQFNLTSLENLIQTARMSKIHSPLGSVESPKHADGNPISTDHQVTS